jgi:hypothetical protein
MKRNFPRKILFFTAISVLVVSGFLFILQPDIKVLAYEMASTSYRIQESSINVGGLDSEASTSYKLRETIGETAIGTATSTSYNLKMGYQAMLGGYISLSVSTSSVVLLPAIGAIVGGIANSSYSATVTTDNPGGYALYVVASTNSALKSGANSFVDYLPVAVGTPDFTWLVAATTSGFGFTPEGTDIVQKFLDNGVNACNAGSSTTSDACWYGFSTSTETIATDLSSNAPSGTETTIKLKAESGSSNSQAAGAYQAVITNSAVAL